MFQSSCCVVGEVGPPALEKSSARWANSSRPTVPPCLGLWSNTMGTSPNNFHALSSATRSRFNFARHLSRNATPKLKRNLPLRNLGHDFNIGMRCKKTTLRFTESHCCQHSNGRSDGTERGTRTGAGGGTCCKRTSTLPVISRATFMVTKTNTWRRHLWLR